MERSPLASSNIAEAGYDEPSQTLEIMFKDGRIYQYFDVPSNIFEGLKADGSPGKYFFANIKGVYRFSRL